MKAVDIMTSLTAVKTRQTSRQLQQHSEISDNRSNTTQFPTAKTVYSVILDSRSNTANQHFISFTSALTQFFLFTLKTALSVSYTFHRFHAQEGLVILIQLMYGRTIHALLLSENNISVGKQVNVLF